MNTLPPLPPHIERLPDDHPLRRAFEERLRQQPKPEPAKKS